MSADTNSPVPEQQLPSPNCAVAEFGARLERIEHVVDEIKVAVIGNPKYGHRGVISRVDGHDITIADHEKRFEKHERKIAAWAATLTGAFGALVFLKDVIFKK